MVGSGWEMLDACLWGFCSLDFMTAMTTSAHVCDVFHGQFNKVSLIFFLFFFFRLPKNPGDVTSFLFPFSLSLSLSAHCPGWGVLLLFSSGRFLARFQFSRRIAFCFFAPPNRIGFDLDFRLRMIRQLTIIYFLLYVSLSFFALSLSSRSGFLFFFYKYI